jgi:integrase
VFTSSSEQSLSIRLSAKHKGRMRLEPVWIARYRIAGKDSAKVLGKAWTKRSRAPEGYLTRGDAELEAQHVLASVAADVKTTSGATFAQVAEEYVALLTARIRTGSFRPSTLRTYENIIEHDLLPLWAERPIAGITGAEIGAYHRRLVDRSLAASTLNQTRAVVRGIFNVAVERHALEHDPSVAFKRAKSRRATSGQISFYPPDEVMRLVEHAASAQDGALFLTAAFTGLRASELRALRWRSIDFANSLVHVERGFTDAGGEDLPKSYRVRSVPMMPQVALALTRLRDREFFTEDDDLVFASDIGSVLNYDQLARRYRATQARAGLRPLRFHDLRHSFGTMAVRQFPITDVQTWMGHADISTTRKYIHYAPQPEAAAKLGALVGERLTEATRLRPAS